MGYYTFYDLYIECQKEEEFTTICDYLEKILKNSSLEPFHEHFPLQQNSEIMEQEKNQKIYGQIIF